MESNKTNALAITSMVLGILAIIIPLIGILIGIVAVIIGIKALNQLKVSTEKGKGLAIAGIVCGGGGPFIQLIFLLIIGVISFFNTPQ
ncbi:hypothetical protein ANABIO32_05860 [Rossellomorea marisflavi]|uniref:DUF4190 domain-containing protein n=1 Tax=Rossellomorea marisflavi TaxID=189381 RepID=UPI0006FB6695|nr:DUF4190 domain-containing protein [Rossellomorea marisflavi]KQU63118.1 hypothetical protein ASG66_01515 [Bacillus sp. Leaf406]UTE72339.1 DUF4190 domain-containing protein [Rossellomorea marisflavi]WJV18305.1 DUF4190 domain-containing protein [Rossellomorea marisflavi]GLI82898.1 hypothetical protein ANABIO32_05860 [Rossellomorea marisflavi]